MFTYFLISHEKEQCFYFLTRKSHIYDITVIDCSRKKQITVILVNVLHIMSATV